jgi:hypothetical protein
MKQWHFNQTIGYVKALDVMYVKIQELEYQIEEEELNDEEEHEKETKAVHKPKDDETTPNGKLLMKGKEVTKKLMTHKEHKDIAIGVEIKWIKTKNLKKNYELVAPWVESPTMAKQISIQLCSRSDTIHMMLEMEYLYPLMPNLEAYYLFY